MTNFADLTAYKRGSTYICKAVVTNPDTGALVDPTSITAGFTKADGSTVTAAAMSKDSTGTYHLDYAIPSDAVQGVWRPFVTATTGTRVKIDESEFLVTA